MSKIPVELNKIRKKELDMEILRDGIMAELDAINLYEQLASQASDDDIKKVFLDVAGEEKTHVGEFQAMLLRIDEEQVRELKKGNKEVKDLTGK